MYYNPDTKEVLTHQEVLKRNPGMTIPENSNLEFMGLFTLHEVPLEPLPRGARWIENDPVFDGTRWNRSFTMLQASVEQLVYLITEEVRAQRKQIEFGGINIDGFLFATAIEDQNRITSVVANMRLANITQIDFHTETEWITLSADNMEMVASRVALHVQACFSAARNHMDNVDALVAAGGPDLVTALTNYDTTTGWPTP